MNNQLKRWIAQAESWQCALELEVPRSRLARYTVLNRTDDLYICSFSAIFKALRVEDGEERRKMLLDIAASLHVFSSRSTHAQLSGVEHNLNLLYVAALYYIAGYPATATLISKGIDAFHFKDINPVEVFLFYFLRRDSKLLETATRQIVDSDEQLFIFSITKEFSTFIASGDDSHLLSVHKILLNAESFGLDHNPRCYIAAKLAGECISQFVHSNLWKALQSHVPDYMAETWRPLIRKNFYSPTPLWELFPSQLKALEAGLVGTTQTVSLQMPTSAGKTALCELLIYHEVKSLKHKVLFLVPFRALAAEIKEGLAKRLSTMGISIVASYGGNVPSTSERGEVLGTDVLIVTPEKYQALDQVLDGFSNRYSTVICDEGHLIDDDNRGLSYELLLTKLRADTQNSKRFVFLSAIIPNVVDLHRWLKGDENGLVESSYKPVETEIALLEKHGAGYGLVVNPTHALPEKYFVKDVILQEDFRYISPDTGRRNTLLRWESLGSLACRIALKSRKAGAVAIFTSTKGAQGVMGLSNNLVKMLKALPGEITAQPSLLEELVEYMRMLFGHEYSLVKLLEMGAVFHHGDLPQETRRAIEEAIHNHLIDLIICTSTLAEGVNLPVRTLVIHCTDFRTGAGEDNHHTVEQRSLKNIVGRAGRAGKETKGRAIFVNSRDHARARNLAKNLKLERSRGFLIRLIEAIEKYRVDSGGVALTNELFEGDSDYIKEIIDHIDSALIDLLTEDLQEVTDASVSELVENTLAYQQCDTVGLKKCIKEVFSLRLRYLERAFETIPLSTFKKAGTIPRFVNFINSRDLADHDLWANLEDALAPSWIDEIVLPLLEYPLFASRINAEKCRILVVSWMSGKTYKESATEVGDDVEEVLPFYQKEIWYKLQTYMGQLSKLAKLQRGTLPELSENWPSLLQYGIHSLQQLDMMERGLSDRLAVHGISRWLVKNDHQERGKFLLLLLNQEQAKILAYLRADERVPEYSVKLTENELFNLWG